MVIEKLHGLQATNISLNDRFTLLATTVPVRQAARVPRQRRRSTGLFSFGQQINNRNLIDQIAQRLGQQSKRNAVRQRLGIPALREFGSESSLPGLRRSNSFSNLSVRSVQARAPWRQSNGNLSRSTSFSNLSQSTWRGRGRGFRRRGGRMGLMRGRMRARGGKQQIVGRMRGQARGQRRTMRGQTGQNGRGRQYSRGARGRGRGAGQGGVSTAQKPALTKEDLDLELDQYMASTKTALDRELDTYMKNAMEME